MIFPFILPFPWIFSLEYLHVRIIFPHLNLITNKNEELIKLYLYSNMRNSDFDI